MLDSSGYSYWKQNKFTWGFEGMFRLNIQLIIFLSNDFL